MKTFSIVCMSLFGAATVFGVKDYVQASRNGLLNKLYVEEAIPEEQPVPKKYDLEVDDYSRKALDTKPAEKTTIKEAKKKQVDLQDAPPPPPTINSKDIKIEKKLSLKNFSRSRIVDFVQPKEELAIELKVTDSTLVTTDSTDTEN
jgi:hypothetical protein